MRLLRRDEDVSSFAENVPLLSSSLVAVDSMRAENVADANPRSACTAATAAADACNDVASDPRPEVAANSADQLWHIVASAWIAIGSTFISPTLAV